MVEFRAWGKTPRWNSKWVITEKIDGTNAAVGIEYLTLDDVGEDGGYFALHDPNVTRVSDVVEDWFPEGVIGYKVWAQSRNRIIVPGDDNYGFAKYVYDNASVLARTLGEGLHFGEWWGKGIQRGYRIDERRFSLFNVNRYADVEVPEIGLGTVPVLFTGFMEEPFPGNDIAEAISELEDYGSAAAPGFPHPEGVVAFHVRSGQTFKAFTQWESK